MSNLTTVNISIPFPSPREADIAYQVLRVDAEPKRSGVTKNLQVKENILHVNFVGSEAKKVRVGITAFFDGINLIIETMKEFDSRESEYHFYY